MEPTAGSPMESTPTTGGAESRDAQTDPESPDAALSMLDAGIADAQPDTKPIDAASSPTGPDLERGQVLYTAYCGFCHGVEGEGYAADNANALSHPQFLAVADEDFLRDAIKYGRPGTPMSGWGEVAGGPLSEDDVGHLVAYIEQWRTDLMPVIGGEHMGEAQRGEPSTRCTALPVTVILVKGKRLCLNNPRF